MRLTINDEAVTFTLESEKTLGQVADGVQAWLAASGFLVTGLQADGRNLLLLPAGEWAAAEVGTIQSLSVTAVPTGDMRIEHWRTLHTWLGMLHDEIAATKGPAPSKDVDALAELLADLPQTLEGLAANPFLPAGSDLVSRLDALLKGADSSVVRSWTAEKREEAAGLCAEMRARIEARLADALHPKDALARSARTLKELLGGLSEVSVLLQTGRDRQAMERIVGFTDAARELIDVLPFLPPDAERARRLTELTPFLRELVAAFGKRDAILIGDLLEYEIAPRMGRIMPLLESAP